MISMRIEKCRHLAIAAAAMAACLNLFRALAAPVPIQVSSNGHYFVNARGDGLACRDCPAIMTL
jgi:hypothetical protein